MSEFFTLERNSFVRYCISQLFVFVFALFSTMAFASGIDKNLDFEIFGGVVLADLGGESDPGISMGCVFSPELHSERILFKIGFEYSEKRSEGHLFDGDAYSGTILYDGPGTVSLDYLTTWLGVQYCIDFRNVYFSPYLGVGMAFLLDQKVELPIDPGNDAFDGFSWYRDNDFLVISGFEFRFRRVALDIQGQFGMKPLDVDWSSKPAGWAPNGVPFTDYRQHCKSLRIGLGYVF